MARNRKSNGNEGKRVTRYTYNDVREPQVPETGHTALLPADEQVVTLPMDNGWSKAIEVGKLPEDDERPVVVDMDPAADPVLFWAGKRNKRDVPVLPLQRNEIVTDSRIAHIIERARKAAAEKKPQARQASLFADLEKTLRETDRSKRVEFYTHEKLRCQVYTIHRCHLDPAAILLVSHQFFVEETVQSSGTVLIFLLDNRQIQTNYLD